MAIVVGQAARVVANDRFWRWSQWVDATPRLVSNSLIWWQQDPRFASAVDRHSRLHCHKAALRKGLNNKILPVGAQVLRRPVEIAAGSGHSRASAMDPKRSDRWPARRPAFVVVGCPMFDSAQTVGRWHVENPRFVAARQSELHTSGCRRSLWKVIT